MPHKWSNRIITRCSSNENVAISVSKTLLQLDLVTSIQRAVQCCHLASPNLKNSHVSSNNFHVSICFHSREKKLGDLRTWTPHVHVDSNYLIKTDHKLNLVSAIILCIYCIHTMQNKLHKFKAQYDFDRSSWTGLTTHSNTENSDYIK